MIQDIYPSKLNTEYFPYEMTDKDILVSFNREGEVLLGKQGDKPLFPKLSVADDDKIIY